MIPNNRNKKGTGFTNLSRILQASKGSRLGGQVASGVQKVGQQVRGQIGQASEQFQKKAGEEAAKFGENAQAMRDEEINQVVSGNEDVNVPKLADKFTEYRSGEYKGPREIQDYESLAGKVTEAEQLGRLGRTSGGKQELLRRFVGGKDYSQGEQRLDTALLGLTGQQGLAEARRSTRGLTSELGSESGAARNLAQQLQKEAEGFADETTKKIDQAKLGVSQGLNTRVSEAAAKEKQRSDFVSDIRTMLNTNEWKDLKPEEKSARLNSLLSKAGPKSETNLEGSGILSQEQVDSILGSQGVLASRNEFLKRLDTIKKKGFLYETPLSDAPDWWIRHQQQADADKRLKDRQHGVKHAGSLYADVGGTGEQERGIQARNKVLAIQKKLTGQDVYSDIINSLENIGSQNLNRQGFVTPEEREKFNRLDMLLGQAGGEFTQPETTYKEGNLKFLNQNQSKLKFMEDQLNLAKLKYKSLATIIDTDIERRYLKRKDGRGEAYRTHQRLIDASNEDLKRQQAEYDKQLAIVKKEEDDELKGIV
jgi:hypothetical protein